MKAAFVCAAGLGLALASSGPLAQISWKSTCTNTGTGSAESLAEGHTLTVGAATCVIEGGPLHGAVSTQGAMWETVKGEATLLSGDGVVRKPGTTAVYRLTGGRMTLLTKEGRPAGWTARGSGVFTLGVGEGTVLKGRPYSWTANATGPGKYAVEVTVD
jgi:hypothetical protein